jgi:carboxylesterase type B
VDASLVPDLPARLFARGAFDHNIQVMDGYNSNEGLLFTDPRITDDAELAALLRRTFPDIQDSVIDYIINTLYPAVYDGSQPYLNAIDRTSLLIAEVGFNCISNFVGRAYMNETYNYHFSVPPGFHAEDLPYTFYNGDQPGLKVNETLAVAFQKYLTSFAQGSVPRGEGLPNFPTYGPSATQLNLNISGIETIKGRADNPRCRFWQTAQFT